MSEGKNTNKKTLIGAIILIVVVAVMAVVYINFREKPVEGSKQITIEVVGRSGQSTVYELKTDAEYLDQAMEDADGLTFAGEDGQFGMVINTINGETADIGENAYWSFYVNDEYCNYGVSEQPVKDGDRFRIEYATF